MYRWHHYMYVSMCVIGCYWYSVLLLFYCLWWVSMQILYNYGCICATVWCTIISLHPPSYDTVRCGFCLTMLCIYDDLVSFFFVLITDLSLYLLLLATVLLLLHGDSFILGNDRFWDVLT